MFGERVVGVLPNLIVAYMFVGLLLCGIACEDISECGAKYKISVGTYIVGLFLCTVFWPVLILIHAIQFIRIMYKHSKES